MKMLTASVVFGFGICYLIWCFITWSWVSIPDATIPARVMYLYCSLSTSLLTWLGNK